MDISKSIYDNFAATAERRGDRTAVYYLGTRYSYNRVRSLAERFASALTDMGVDFHIFYVAPAHAMLPSFNGRSSWIRITDVQRVYDVMKELLTTKKIDWVIHSMAISDFAVADAYRTGDFLRYVIESSLGLAAQGKNASEILETINEGLDNDKSISFDRKGKIPSSEDITVLMKQTPKIIGSIKKWQPDTRLVGFKLQNGVSEDELLEAAVKTEKANQCEFVIANDYTKVFEKSHEAMLVRNGEITERFYTKAEIAGGIVERIKGAE